MKVLIVGENSYIGNFFQNLYGDSLNISVIDARKPLDIEQYKGFDVVFHLAAIVHKKETKDIKDLYDVVNNKLSVQSCKFAKEAGAKQFIFMSTMAIYGGDSKIGVRDVVTKETKPNPVTYYGTTKLAAESEMVKLNNSKFKVMIVRPPMVYGNGCKGNYPKLLKIAKLLPFVPNLDNERSTISVDNLCKFIKLGIDKCFEGIYFPQDPEFANTKTIMINYKKSIGKKVHLTKLFNPLIRFTGLFYKPLRKAFGSKVYEIGEVDKTIGVRY